MKRISMVLFLAGLAGLDAQAQTITRTQKKPDVFLTPTDILIDRTRRNYTDEEANTYYWEVREKTAPSERKIVRGVRTSEKTPWLSARTLWAAQTMVARSAERGSGPLSKKATEGPTLEDRLQASETPEDVYSGKAENDAILAAVYRHFFGYRSRGFGKETTEYFLGLGPHKDDAPPSVIAALQNDAVLKKDKVTLRPASRALEITDAAIRDLDTGAFGAIYRVDGIGPIQNGEVKVVGTFGEKDGFFFTQELTLRQEKDGWKVVKESDLPVNWD